MKLKEFIHKLQEIERERGEDAEVIMADFIPIVEPVFLRDRGAGDKVVITDEK